MGLNKSTIKILALTIVAALALTGCGRVTTDEPTQPSVENPTFAPSQPIIVGTTDKVVALDPAGSFDHGSLAVHIQVYSFLYSFVPGEATPQPDAAKECGFASDTVFRCLLRPGLTFANGNILDSSDVKFSFDRQMRINDPEGPASLLENLESIETPDVQTVEFILKQPNDQTFLQVLATSVGPIVDEAVFPPDALISDEDIVANNAFSGPYTITSYKKNDTVEFTPYGGYFGAHELPVNEKVTQKTYTDATNLKLAITNGEIDVGYRSFTPTDIESLQKDDSVTIWSEKGGEIRYMVFNLKTMPGDTPAQKLAVRQAIATSIDRQALSTQVYKGQYSPLCSYIPDGFVGANTAVCDAYGNSPDKDKAAKILTDAGVKTPVKLSIQYNPDHYGSSSDQEYGLIKQQLEATGLFKVNLASTEWVTYNKERVKDGYQIYQLGWFPDYPDGDNYLMPFFHTNNFLYNHFSDPAVDKALEEQVAELDPTKRAQELENIQTTMAGHLSTVPLLQGSQWAVSRTNITGIVLGVDENLHFNTIAKS